MTTLALFLDMQNDREAERQKSREAERQRGREAERQNNREEKNAEGDSMMQILAVAVASRLQILTIASANRQSSALDPAFAKQPAAPRSPLHPFVINSNEGTNSALIFSDSSSILLYRLAPRYR